MKPKVQYLREGVSVSGRRCRVCYSEIKKKVFIHKLFVVIHQLKVSILRKEFVKLTLILECLMSAFAFEICIKIAVDLSVF